MNEQNRPTTSSLPPGTGVGSATLRVLDLPRVEAFYRDVIGLQRRTADATGVELGTTRRTVLRLEPGAKRLHRPGEPGLYHLAYLLPRRADLGAWLRHVLANGWPLQGAADHAVSEAVYLADPEGNGVEVVVDRPQEHWPVDGDRIIMTTDPFDAEGVIATADAPWESAPEGACLGHVHLQVSDLGLSGAFYQHAIGLRRSGTAVPRATFLAAGGYHHHLGLNSWGMRPGSVAAPGSSGLHSFDLLVPTEEAIAAAADRLEAAGTQVRRTGGATEAADPEGTVVRLVHGKVEPDSV